MFQLIQLWTKVFNAVLDFFFSRTRGQGRRRLDTTNENEGNRSDTSPWMQPAAVNAQLLNANPGIWTVSEFLSPDRVQRLKAAVERVESTTNLFQTCGPAHGFNSSCTYLSASSPGVHVDDQKLIADLMEDIRSQVWPYKHLYDLHHVFVQRMPEGTPPTLVHMDYRVHDESDIDTSHLAAVSVVVYLTDSLPATVFPDIHLKIPPKAGNLATWLNINADGSANPSSTHGIQANPLGAPDRLAFAMSFFRNFTWVQEERP